MESKWLVLGGSIFLRSTFSTWGTPNACMGSYESYSSSVTLEKGSGRIRFLKGMGYSVSQEIHLSLMTLMK